MIKGTAEYVMLRLARRFLFSNAFLVRFGQFVPYYRKNANQADATSVADRYERAIVLSDLPPVADRVILEIGSGATNSVGYELMRRKLAGTAGRIYLFDPHVALDRGSDSGMRKGLAQESIERVERIASLSALPGQSVDMVVSNSVLEHVADLDGVLGTLERVLTPASCMIHAVDYRDHFFKYPYHFLTFKARTWARWLDPGDLPRWRLGGHLKAFSDFGFETRVLEQDVLKAAFEAIRPDLSEDFDEDDPTLAVATAVLFCRRRGSGMVAKGGIEPPTHGFSIRCSTD